MTTPLKNYECFWCGANIEETHPTCGKGWDLCNECREGIIDSICQDIPMYCAICHKPLTDKDFAGEYELVGDATHAPGKYWVFQHISNSLCEKWSRCHSSKEKNFIDAYKEIEEERKILGEGQENEI